MRSLRIGLLALVVAGTAGCTKIENTLAKVNFLAFMHQSPSVDPYEMPRPAPVGSVPSNSPHGDAPYASGNTQPQLLELASRARSPLQPGDTAALAHGQVLFARHCAVCHGPQGRGDGTILGPGRFPFAPSLVTPVVAGYSDSYIYAVLRQGRGLMPAYGPRMTETERWQVVSYVRTLGAAGAQAPAQTTAAPAQTTTAAPATSGTATTQR